MQRPQVPEKKLASEPKQKPVQPKISSFFSPSPENKVRTMNTNAGPSRTLKGNVQVLGNNEISKKRKLDQLSEVRKMSKGQDSQQIRNTEAITTQRTNSNVFGAKPSSSKYSTTTQSHSNSGTKEIERKKRQSPASKTLLPRQIKYECDNDIMIIKVVPKKLNKTRNVPSKCSIPVRTNIEGSSKKNSNDQNDPIKNKKPGVSVGTLVNEVANDSVLIQNLDELFEDDWDADLQLDLTKYQRCRVIEILRKPKSTILTITHATSECITRVHCSGSWQDLHVEVNDIISVQAKNEGEYWVVDNNSGFLVINPDLLISGTTIASSLFCMRRAVLSEKFKKIEGLPYYDCDNNNAATIGSLVHQLLQQAICENVTSVLDVIQIINRIMKSRSTAGSLYGSGISYNECKEKMLAFAQRIYEFIQHYMNGKEQPVIRDMKENFKGKIVEVRDIEECIWMPELGVKGKIDVSALVKIHSKKKLMPLEIKTGRSSFSPEHKGQVILYNMLMELTGQDVDTGLLLYIKDNKLQEVKGGHREHRDLLQLRNTLEEYFSWKPTATNSETDADLSLPTVNLPKPIDHHSACKSCSYNTMCCVYLSRDKEVKLDESHPLMEISKEILLNLKPSDMDYVLNWIMLLELEEVAQNSENRLKELWTLSPKNREAKGKCMANLKLLKVRFIEESSRYEHVFIRGETLTNSNNVEFVRNDCIIVSTDTQTNISMGFVFDVSKDIVSVLLDRNITKKNNNKKFHIDKYTSATVNYYNYASVAGLLSDDPICTKLRSIVIDKKPATFSKETKVSSIIDSVKILNELNEDQQLAVLKATTANEYMLIKGMPGTGKTKTLVALIKLLNRMSYSILITAYTHSAVDNILLKLLDENIDFLRLGSEGSIHPSLIGNSEFKLTANCRTPESLDAVYKSKNIVAVTCLGSYHMLLGKRIFDFCIVDESAQAFQPSIIRPLYNAKKFILAGDPNQLAPVIKSKKAKKLGADESLFARLDSENNTVTLKSQYRMNNCIMEVANKLTYCDKLVAGNEEVESSTFVAPHMANLTGHEMWKQRVCSRKIQTSVVILNTDCTYDLDIVDHLRKKFTEADCMCANIWEAGIILQLAKTLQKLGVRKENIGVVAPYRSQVGLLRKILDTEVEVNTVDQYQGRDKSIILYSCTKSFSRQWANSDNATAESNKKRDLEILEDHRRLTVAVTRAKHKLIVIADKESVAQYTPFKKLFEIVGPERIIHLKNGCDDFAWTNIESAL